MANNPEDDALTGVIVLDVNEDQWQINGTTYFKTKRMVTERWQLLERHDIQFGFAANFKSLFDKIGEAYQLGNARKDLDLGVALHNILHGMANVDSAYTFAFELCTILMNYEGENLREFTEETRLKKLRDFKEGGVDVGFFFRLAAISTPGFLAAYRTIVQDTSA